MKQTYVKLRNRIYKSFPSQTAFSKVMGMSTTTIHRKLTGKSQWTRLEMEKACIFLGITVDDMHLYFFPD